MYVYCLFCVTQRCRIIAQVLEARGVDRAFAPQIIRKQRKQGVNMEKTYDLLPGYVFIFHEEELVFSDIFWGIDGVIRHVGRSEDRKELSGPDREFALGLYEKQGIVRGMMMYREGDQVKLKDPLFNHSQGRVTKVDYKKQRARVDFQFNGLQCHTWVACEGIEPERKDGETESGRLILE